MKKRVVLSLAVAILAGISNVFAANPVKTEKFKVHGNCGMCESRIEKAASSVEGVSSADWDKKALVMTVQYDESKTDIKKVHVAIASAGHDTEKQRADDKVYDKLHSCCKYKRAAVKAPEDKKQ